MSLGRKIWTKPKKEIYKWLEKYIFHSEITYTYTPINWMVLSLDDDL